MEKIEAETQSTFFGRAADIAVSGLHAAAQYAREARGGHWGELGQAYGQLVGGHEKHRPTI